MMAGGLEKLFDVCVKSPEGKRRGTYCTAKCKTCGKEEDVFAKASTGGNLPPEPVARKFRNMGWVICGKKGQHVCPDCRSGPVPSAAPQAAPPRKPTPDDRRAIFEHLEIVFCTAKGYDAGQSDETVAGELKLPRKWVEDIRDQMFGPIPAPPVDHVANLRKQLDGLTLVAGALGKALDEMGEAVAGLKDGMDAAETTLAALEAEGRKDG